ncbi:hypothetical protein Tco_1019064 [Tanacetum coccineum]|uniref:Uncharacterized protein n=1 Tax=Tanacetum coccineum TaxID=301880 RepID=A0ABQ5FWE5_9ASTR
MLTPPGPKWPRPLLCALFSMCLVTWRWCVSSVPLSPVVVSEVPYKLLRENIEFGSRIVVLGKGLLEHGSPELEMGITKGGI